VRNGDFAITTEIVFQVAERAVTSTTKVGGLVEDAGNIFFFSSQFSGKIAGSGWNETWFFSYPTIEDGP
jgi:hypothetical protein